MILIVEEIYEKLEQEVIKKFCEFTRLLPRQFWRIIDKWYNHELFVRDDDGVWHPRFKVGVGLIK